MTNQTGGTINGGRNGVDLFSFTTGATVTNEQGATISGGLNGLNLLNVSTVINQGQILGGTASGVSMGGVGSLTNSGTISATEGIGVSLEGGIVTNQSGGTITGGVFDNGISFRTFLGTVINAGTISSPNAAGVSFLAGGVVTNQTGGTISSQNNAGILFVNAAGTVVNAGTISGASVRFAGTGDNVLTLQTGSVLNGDAVGSTATGATNSLILQGNGTANNNFLNFNSLDVQASGTWTLNGSSQVGAATVNSGVLEIGDAAHPSAELIGTVTGEHRRSPGGARPDHRRPQCHWWRYGITRRRGWDHDWDFDRHRQCDLRDQFDFRGQCQWRRTGQQASAVFGGTAAFDRRERKSDGGRHLCSLDPVHDPDALLAVWAAPHSAAFLAISPFSHRR